MKSFWKTTLSASLIAIAATTLIPGHTENEDPTTLSEFGGYRLTDVGGTRLKDLYASLTSDLSVDDKGNCYQRAHMWSYQLYKQNHVQSGKIFLFYAWNKYPSKPSSWNFNGQGWWFHVAPYVVADGKEYVLEKFGEIQVPMLLTDWVKRQSGGNTCLVPSAKNKKDRKNFFKPISDINRAMSFENDLGPCFIRKAPMYYKTTGSIGAQGTNDAEYNTFSTNDVFNSCINTLDGDGQSRNLRCSRFAANGNPAELSAPVAMRNGDESSTAALITPEFIQEGTSSISVAPF